MDKVQGIKSRLAFIAKVIFDEHEKAKQKLIESINYERVTQTFGDAQIDEVKRTESVVLALSMSKEWFDSDDFQKVTDEWVFERVKTLKESLECRQRNLFNTGLSVKEHWEASGVMQLLSKLESVIH